MRFYQTLIAPVHWWRFYPRTLYIVYKGEERGVLAIEEIIVRNDFEGTPSFLEGIPMISDVAIAVNEYEAWLKFRQRLISKRGQEPTV